jgi:hypothetical protein
MSEESKGYRLFDPVTNRVVVSRDVFFEEDKQWDWAVSNADQISFDLVWGDTDNGDLGVREGNDEERRELGDDSVENFEEEAEEIVSVEETRDVENHEREENATGRSAQSGSHYAHPTAAASPAGRIGENPSHPTARVLPDSGMDDRGDLTASSGHGGSASGNPTARRHADDNTGDRGAYSNPTVRNMDGSADADLTARRHTGGRAVRHAGGCADIDDPTGRLHPGVCLERSPNRAAEESPSVGSVGLIDSPVSFNPTADFWARRNREGDLLTCGRRERVPPNWMQDYVTGEELSDPESNMAFIMSSDPFYFEDAVKITHWRLAMDSEINAIEKNNTWTLTELPEGAKKIGVKWVYKTKYNEHGDVDKYKARLVAKGYSQQHGIDYTEVFAPVARMDTVRMIIALAAQKNWTIYQLDVKSAFLHGELQEDVYVSQPKGYEKKGREHQVYKLHKALYGLKQAPRAWFSRIETHFINEGFFRCESEQTLFTKRSREGKIIIVSVYVDDLIFTGDDANMLFDFKKSMMREFDMSDLGKMRYFLGIEVLQNSGGIYICQKKYALEVLKRFGMMECNAVKNPIVPGCKVNKDEDGVKVDETYYKQLVGSLMYLTATRPDMMFVTCLISRYMAKPTELHLQIAKRALRYLRGTVNFGIQYKKGGSNELLAFTDSDYAGDIEDRKSTSGYVFVLSSGAVSWSSKKQPIVTLSTTEAEFVAAAMCVCQALWIKRVLKELGYSNEYCIQVKCDNNSTIKLSKNPVMHGRSKHIDVRYHFLRNLTKEGTIALVHCGSQDQVADLMTKPLKLDAFLKLRTLLGVQEIIDVN